MGESCAKREKPQHFTVFRRPIKKSCFYKYESEAPMQDTLFKIFCNFFKHCIPQCLSEFILVKGD